VNVFVTEGVDAANFYVIALVKIWRGEVTVEKTGFMLPQDLCVLTLQIRRQFQFATDESHVAIWVADVFWLEQLVSSHL